MFQRFIHEEAGAGTVEMVVLMAALVGLGLAMMGVTGDGLEAQSGAIETQLATTDAGASPFTE